jgi:hypothetical protein
MAFETPIQGGVDLAATTETDVLATSADTIAYVTITNRTTSPVAVRLGIATGGGSLGNAEYDLYDFSLAANDSIKRGPFSLPNGDDIRGYAAATGITMRYDGWTA